MDYYRVARNPPRAETTSCRPTYRYESRPIPKARFWIVSELPTRTKPLARRTLPRG